MAWAPLFFYTAFYIGYKRQQGLLQQILRQRAAIFPDRGQIWAFPQKGYSKMDEITLFPKWIFNFLFCNVLQYALEHQGVKNLNTVVTLLWTFKLPWHWAYHGSLFSDGAAQFAFGFYSVMLTSTILGLLTMILYKPRSWCVYCPMGTMTQIICKTKNVTSSQKKTGNN